MLFENSIRTTASSSTCFEMTIVYDGDIRIAKISTQSNDHDAQRSEMCGVDSMELFNLDNKIKERKTFICFKPGEI